MNSALQCFSQVHELHKYFLFNSFMKDLNEDNVISTGGRLAATISELLKELWIGSDKAIVPRNFYRVIGRFASQFQGYKQQDSLELFLYLLDGLHEDLNKVLEKPTTELIESNGRPDAYVSRISWENHLKRNKSVVLDLFGGQYKSKVECPSCDRVSVCFDPFMIISLPIPLDTKSPTLYDCLDKFTSPETLQAGNEWYCNVCKEHKLAQKTMSVFKSPKILVIQLLRFKTARIHHIGTFHFPGRTEKISRIVDFPLDGLDLTKYVLEQGEGGGAPLIYDLFAVSNHYGSLLGGHYTAYVKNHIKEKWFEMDDSQVSEHEEEGVVTKAAYFLCYRRRDAAAK